VRYHLLTSLSLALQARTFRDAEITARLIGAFDFADMIRQTADVLELGREPLTCEVPVHSTVDDRPVDSRGDCVRFYPG